jgi:hypothetical protein
MTRRTTLVFIVGLAVYCFGSRLVVMQIAGSASRIGLRVEHAPPLGERTAAGSRAGSRALGYGIREFGRLRPRGRLLYGQV